MNFVQLSEISPGLENPLPKDAWLILELIDAFLKDTAELRSIDLADGQPPRGSIPPPFQLSNLGKFLLTSDPTHPLFFLKLSRKTRVLVLFHCVWGIIIWLIYWDFPASFSSSRAKNKLLGEGILADWGALNWFSSYVRKPSRYGGALRTMLRIVVPSQIRQAFSMSKKKQRKKHKKQKWLFAHCTV